MVFYQLDYVVEEVRKNEPSVEQKRLRKYVGADFTKEEAAFIWERVIDHKWYVGERLQRDIGWRVAAIDYVENFYDASIFRKNNKRNRFFNRILKPVSQTAQSYFVSKSKTSPSL